MIYVNDCFFDENFFERCNTAFDQHSIISQCKGRRIAVCMSDIATWIALCLYIKKKCGAVFPLPIDTPLAAAQERAKLAQCQYLIFGDDATASDDHCEMLMDATEVFSGSLIQMSSGTTGDPKIIERSWSSIDLEISSYITEAFPEGNSMIPVVACPVNHSYGLICGVLVALKRGVHPVIVSNNNPKYILKRIQSLESYIVYSSPVLLGAIAMLVEGKAPIKAVMTSGSVMQKPFFENLKLKVLNIYQQYGCSEVGCISLAKNISSENEVGNVLPHLKIYAGSNSDTPKEIVATLPDGNKVSTCDLGFFDSNNILHFTSRIDDMINVSGFNVYPSEVENIILGMPNILDVVVFKRQHALGHDQVCLNYVSDVELLNSEIRQWCKSRLSSHQIPMVISSVDEIPRLPNGKVSRNKIADSLA